MIMDVISRRISLTAWGRLYGFDKATTSRMHHAGRLPAELQIEQLPNGRYYVVVPPENDGRLVVYARVSSADQKEDPRIKSGAGFGPAGRAGRRMGNAAGLPTRRSRKGDRFRFEWQPSPFAASGGGPYGEHDRG